MNICSSLVFVYLLAEYWALTRVASAELGVLTQRAFTNCSLGAAICGHGKKPAGLLCTFYARVRPRVAGATVQLPR